MQKFQWTLDRRSHGRFGLARVCVTRQANGCGLDPSVKGIAHSLHPLRNALSVMSYALSVRFSYAHKLIDRERTMPAFRVAVLSLTLLGGCTSLPTPQQISTADYGQYPENYEAIVKSFYNMALKDPESARYGNISTPYRTYLGSRIDETKYGWLTCASVNAKNSFGAYTGYSTDALLIKNGAVIQHVPKGNWWGKQVC